MGIEFALPQLTDRIEKAERIVELAENASSHIHSSSYRAAVEGSSRNEYMEILICLLF